VSSKVVDEIRSGLGDRVISLEVRSPRRVYIELKPEHLVAAARYLFSDLGARYAIASGMQTETGFEVLHHFAFDAAHMVVSLRVKTDSANPELDSLAPFIKGAEFIEREMHDLLGIEFRGHPNLSRLILPDDWPEGVFPLRRGRPWEGKVRKEV
jgi:Ni,Fe-hydrogenase III component G